MSWSYGKDPVNSTTDEVRLMVGDTDRSQQLLQDEEILYFLDLYPKTTGKPAYLAGAAACDAIVAKLARTTDKTIDVISKPESQKFDHYAALAGQLRLAYRSGGMGNGATPAIPRLGGGGSTVLGDTTLWTQSNY